jgi:2-keto-4-pentenoate hydratase/2-oxohepta-3-ene-1,7-dioic acid hydratase in catechol pathway
MKLCRFQPLEFAAAEIARAPHESYPQPRHGIVESDSVHEFSGALWGPRERTGRKWPLDSVIFLPPSTPSKIVCVGKNYADHAAEMGGPPPAQPLIFFKPPSAIIAPEEPIVLPSLSQRVDCEGELAIVIGRRCRLLGPADDVRPYILGYTCLNDVTARDIQKLDGQWTRGKGFDTFCPVGPIVSNEIDPASGTPLTLTTRLNGVVKQQGSTRDLIFTIAHLLRYITATMTLEPGDLIPTGTPAGVGSVQPGDRIQIEIDGLGTLENVFAAES